MTMVLYPVEAVYLKSKNTISIIDLTRPLKYRSVTDFMDTNEIFEFYRTEFVPAYSDLVGYIGDKPQQILIELENTLAHISQLFNHTLDHQDENVNLEKAHDHLVRATLDCYKLLWAHIYEQLTIIEKNESN